MPEFRGFMTKEMVIFVKKEDLAVWSERCKNGEQASFSGSQREVHK
jgi:hypothetical protein